MTGQALILVLPTCQRKHTDLYNYLSLIGSEVTSGGTDAIFRRGKNQTLNPVQSAVLSIAGEIVPRRNRTQEKSYPN